jgi:cytochrome c oxidase subunit 2
MMKLKIALAAIGLALAPGAVLAQEAAPAPAVTNATAGPDSTAEGPELAGAATASNAAEANAGPAFLSEKPIDGVGQPVNGALSLQPQVTDNGLQAHWMHDYILMPIMVIICLFVLGLMLWVIARYRAKANPIPSKTTHNTFIEVIWTLLPVLILVGIAIPSISLLARQYKPAPANAVTIKAIGNQWYWGYEYPDHGIELTSNMLDPEEAKKRGEPGLLAVDNRVVVPVGVPIKMLVTANDVIHSWAVPAFWVKMDAVPGRTNEVTFTVDKPGIYYGQCSELCGARHAYMPIAVQAVSPAQFAEWVGAKGGKMPAEKAAEEAAAAAAGAANNTAAANTANTANATNAAEAAPAAANATPAAANAATGS